MLINKVRWVMPRWWHHSCAVESLGSWQSSASASRIFKRQILQRKKDVFAPEESQNRSCSCMCLHDIVDHQATPSLIPNGSSQLHRASRPPLGATLPPMPGHQTCRVKKKNCTSAWTTKTLGFIPHVCRRLRCLDQCGWDGVGRRRGCHAGRARTLYVVLKSR